MEAPYQNEDWDVIIVGAGPIGLSAAIFIGNLGLKTLILEKGSHSGPEPRGETIRYDPILDELLGEGQILKEGKGILTQKKTFDNLINSPKCEKEYLHTESLGVNTFKWEKFIYLLEQNAIKSQNTTILYNRDIIQLIITEDNICIGVKTAKEEFYGHTILDASGAKTKIGRELGIDYNKITYPIVKSQIFNFYSKINGFESFFCPTGSFEKYPDFPPSMIFIFPHLDGIAEIGIIIFAEFAKDSEILTNEYIIEVWHYAKNEYCKLKKLLEKTSTRYEFVTQIGSQNMIKEPIVIPGLILIGGAAGFLDPSKAAGFLSGMKSAKIWAGFLKDMKDKKWNKQEMDNINKNFQKTDIYITVKKLYKTIKFSKFMAYKLLKTPKALNRFWFIIKSGKKRLG